MSRLHDGPCPQPCCVDAYLARKAGILDAQAPGEMDSPRIRYGQPLSPAELRVLVAYTWQGNEAAAGRMLGRSSHTVSRTLKQARVKLGAKSATNAVWLAWAQIGPLYERLEAGDQSVLHADNEESAGGRSGIAATTADGS